MYDLLVVGNGLAAQTLLFEIKKSLQLEDMNCQNFSVAQIFSEDLAPACTLRSTSTVSLNGIEEGISELGDTLRNSFYAFEAFFKEHSLPFIEPVRQTIIATDSYKLQALNRRYKKLDQIKIPLLKTSYEGVELQSYLVVPEKIHAWFDEHLENSSINRIKDFLVSFEIDSNGDILSKTQTGLILKSRKIIFCTGAYSSIFSSFFPSVQIGVNQQVVAGAYLQKKMSFSQSFLLTVDGLNLLYRRSDQNLILGSASLNSMISLCDISELKSIYTKFSDICQVDLGHFEDFNLITGLRHKASKRMPICRFVDQEKKIGVINGFYKNGYSLPFYLSKVMVKELFSL